MFKTMKQIIKNKSSVRVRSEFLLPSSWKLSGQSSSRETADWDTSSGVCFSSSSETQGQWVGPGERREESFQARVEEPLGTDSHRTISKWSSESWLLIGHKKCFVLLWLIGKQFLLSCFPEFDSYTTAIISPQLPPWFSCYYFRCRLSYQKLCDALKYHTSTISSCMVYSFQSLKKRKDCSFKPSKAISPPAASRMLQCWNWYYSPT